MNRTTTSAARFTILLLVVSFTGCGSSVSERAPGSPSGSPASIHADGADHNAADMKKMKVELAKLPAGDAASVEKQHRCPVSGAMLGTMGAPRKVDLKGSQVWICCDGCRNELLATPDKYLAKLK